MLIYEIKEADRDRIKGALKFFRKQLKIWNKIKDIEEARLNKVPAKTYPFIKDNIRKANKQISHFEMKIKEFKKVIKEGKIVYGS